MRQTAYIKANCFVLTGNPSVSYELLGPVTDGQSVDGTCISYLFSTLFVNQARTSEILCCNSITLV